MVYLTYGHFSKKLLDLQLRKHQDEQAQLPVWRVSLGNNQISNTYGAKKFSLVSQAKFSHRYIIWKKYEKNYIYILRKERSYFSGLLLNYEFDFIQFSNIHCKIQIRHFATKVKIKILRYNVVDLSLYLSTFSSNCYMTHFFTPRLFPFYSGNSLLSIYTLNKDAHLIDKIFLEYWFSLESWNSRMNRYIYECAKQVFPEVGPLN